MRFQQIDQFAAELKAETRASVYQSTKSTHEKRTKLLFDQFADPNRLREIAGEIKQHAIENLDTYLPQVKAKTMVSEEIELAHFLEQHGIEALETDLGEFIVQIDHDHPSHIVRPIIH